METGSASSGHGDSRSASFQAISQTALHPPSFLRPVCFPAAARYPVGTGRAAIRRTMLPESCPVSPRRRFLPTAASNIGRALPAARPSSPTVAASWSGTNLTQPPLLLANRVSDAYRDQRRRPGGGQAGVWYWCRLQDLVIPVPPWREESTPQTFGNVLSSDWIPAFAGMTEAFAGNTSSAYDGSALGRATGRRESVKKASALTTEALRHRGKNATGRIKGWRLQVY
jgi:hypothetical protein